MEAKEYSSSEESEIISTDHKREKVIIKKGNGVTFSEHINDFRLVRENKIIDEK